MENKLELNLNVVLKNKLQESFDVCEYNVINICIDLNLN